MRSEPAISTVRRWLTNPLLCVLLILLTGVDAYLAKGRGAQDPTVVGAFVHRLLLPSGGETLPLDLDGYGVLDPAEGTVVCMNDDTSSYSDWIAQCKTDQLPMVWLFYHTRSDCAGIWQYWARTAHCRIDAHPDGSGRWTPELIQSATRLAASRIAECGWLDQGLLQDLGGGSASRTTFFWTGPAHDLPAVVLLVTTILSVRLTWSHRIWPRLMIQRTRMERGQCPHCGYDLRGIDGGVCPECGRKAEGRA